MKAIRLAKKQGAKIQFTRLLFWSLIVSLRIPKNT